MGFDVKITTKISILDLIMPYTCRGCGRLGEILCERCKKYNVRPECRDGWIYAVGRREGVLVRVVEDYKYKSIRRTAHVLAEMMEKAVPAAISEAVLVPLPTITRHIRERGFDHTLLLAQELAGMREGFSVSLLLRRVNKTVQVGADAETRALQAASAYEAARDDLDALRTYILVDDVSTTGVSLAAAREVLRSVGAKKIYAVVACVGLDDESDADLLGDDVGGSAGDGVDNEVDDCVSENRDN